jgi:hypothetical protein
MKFLSILIIAFFSTTSEWTKEINIDHLFEERWVINAYGGNINEFEDFDLINYNSPEREDLPDHLKYAGITFQRDGTFIEHVWNKCGTGNPPDHFKAEFKIHKSGQESTIKISKSIKWDGEYVIVALTNDSLKLKRKK